MLTIDPNSAVPPYEQLRAQFTAQIRSGDLASGTHLPPVRRLASDLGLAPNTVARTYRELEASGLVQTRGRNGTIVTPRPSEQPADAQALSLAAHYVEAMSALGIDRERAAALLRDV